IGDNRCEGPARRSEVARANACARRDGGGGVADLALDLWDWSAVEVERMVLAVVTQHMTGIVDGPDEVGMGASRPADEPERGADEPWSADGAGRSTPAAATASGYEAERVVGELGPCRVRRAGLTEVRPTAHVATTTPAANASAHAEPLGKTRDARPAEIHTVV